MSVPESPLKVAIAELYHAFEGHSLKPHFERRSHLQAIVAEEASRPDHFNRRTGRTTWRRYLATLLQGAPLRSFPADRLAFYAARAIDTIGDEEDFKHFLPRILEVYAWMPEHRDPLSVAFRKIGQLDFRAWPEIERRSIEAYVEALWDDLSTSPRGAETAGRLLENLAATGMDPFPLLRALRPSSSPLRALRAAQVVNELLGVSSALGGALARWMADGTIAAELRAGAIAHAAEPFAPDLWAAVDRIAEHAAQAGS